MSDLTPPYNPPSTLPRILGINSNIFLNAGIVDFNVANSDTAIPIILPLGFTRFLVNSVRTYAATNSLTVATYSVYTAPGAGGTNLNLGVPQAMTLSSTTDGAINSAQTTGLPQANTQAFTLAAFPILYFRILTPTLVAATATVNLQITPLL